MSRSFYIEIPLSKTKLVFLLLASLLFVLLGIWFIVEPPIDQGMSATKILIASYAAVAFFGVCSVYLIRKLPDTKPGLVITETMIVDNSSGISAGEIPWKEITNITVTQVQRQKFIMIHVNDPESYINAQTGALKKKMMGLNLKMYGTPLFISANGLKISFDELHALLMERFAASRKR